MCEGSREVLQVGGAASLTGVTSGKKHSQSNLKPLALLCNTSSVCAACDSAASAAISDSAHCTPTGYREQLKCVVADPLSHLKHEVVRNVTRDLHGEVSKGSTVVTYQSCAVTGGLSMWTFECIVLAILVVAAPTVIWRKRQAKGAI
ncbi:hypothetical protein WJX72_011799 [[Myrmecia] bisecta]|uniref:Uncharacterized protein n=1 Tax=[Myrmecia] bisecta TaxID=41462 RepID=A0AAW1R9F9_9CHLO